MRARGGRRHVMNASEIAAYYAQREESRMTQRITVTTVKRVLSDGGFTFEPLQVWKNNRTGSIVANMGHDYEAAAQALRDAGMNVKHASSDLIAIEARKVSAA